MGNPVKCEIKNYKTLKRQLRQMQKAPKKVIDRTLADFRERAPGWIAKEVSAHYVMSQKDINARGNMRVVGNTTKGIRIQYSGKVLSPAAFKMTPREPKAAYTLKTEIIRGNPEVLGKVKKLTKKQKRALTKNLTRAGTRTSDHSPIMLMKMKNTSKYLPFQRVDYGRKIEKRTTTSLPQMVDNREVHDNITAVINTNLGKRIDHHMKLLEK